jgi:HSP20 family molecular chaperone IbpA
MAEVFEHDDQVVVTLQIPDVPEEAISITVEGELLVVTSGAAAFERREVALPCAVDADGMQVDFEEGVLVVTLPKVR